VSASGGDSARGGAPEGDEAAGGGATAGGPAWVIGAVGWSISEADAEMPEADAGTAPSTWCPHDTQNRALGGRDAPHCAQNLAMAPLLTRGSAS
jgi:hypothetical protein